MKYFLTIFVFFLSLSLTAQQVKTNAIKFSYKSTLLKKGYSFRLKAVTADSRCPDGTQCIWAGNVQFVVMVYKDKKLIEETALTVAPNNSQEAIDYFTAFLPKSTIKAIYITPYPKKDTVLDRDKYGVELSYK